MSADNIITVEADTVQEAVSRAVKALGLTKDQVVIEVLDEGKQGFLGLGGKKARVKVYPKEEAVAEQALTDILVDLDIKDEAQEELYRPRVVDKRSGVAEVKNGEVIITNPMSEGKYATIRPGKRVNLMVNGKKTDEETYVSEEDELRVEVVNEEPVCDFELSFSEDNVEAFLKLIRRPGAKYRLKDQEPTNSMVLLSEVEEILELPQPQLEDTKKYLAEKGVTQGIDKEALAKVLEEPNCKVPFRVAQGKAPVHGKDAYVVYPFLKEDKDDEEEGLFGRAKLVSVSVGDVVAYKVLLEEGVDGLAVNGEFLQAKVAVDCEIGIKKGCELTEDGMKAVAVIAGRPVVETVGSKSIVNVEPILEVKDVDSSIGDIKFSGDVVVRGDVKDGYKIEANGSVEVFGDVTRAVIQAGSNVTIHKMVLGSTVVAGGLAALYSKILPHLNQVKELLDKTYTVAYQLKNAPGFKVSDLQAKGDGQLIQLLLESKFQELPKVVQEIVTAVADSKQTAHEEVISAVNLLQKSLCGLGPLHLAKVELLPIIAKTVEGVMPVVGSSMSKMDCVKARYIQNSIVQSSGDVIIEGQGCYISTVEAGGEVIVLGNPGIARGVKISAGRNVTVKELGSEFDTQTSVKIKGNGKISAELIHPNVILQVGKEKFRIDNSYRKLDAYVNHEGRLIVEKLHKDEKPR